MQPLLTPKHARKALMGKIHRARSKSCVSKPVAAELSFNSPPWSILW